MKQACCAVSCSFVVVVSVVSVAVIVAAANTQKTFAGPLHTNKQLHTTYRMSGKRTQRARQSKPFLPCLYSSYLAHCIVRYAVPVMPFVIYNVLQYVRLCHNSAACICVVLFFFFFLSLLLYGFVSHANVQVQFFRIRHETWWRNVPKQNLLAQCFVRSFFYLSIALRFFFVSLVSGVKLFDVEGECKRLYKSVIACWYCCWFWAATRWVIRFENFCSSTKSWVCNCVCWWVCLFLCLYYYFIYGDVLLSLYSILWTGFCVHVKYTAHASYATEPVLRHEERPGCICLSL